MTSQKSAAAGKTYQQLKEVLPKAKELGLSRPNSKLGVSTRLIASHLPDRKLTCEPVVTPIYQASVYKRVAGQGYLADDGEPGYAFSRKAYPNSDEACMLINSIEQGAGSLIFPSGMSALTNTLLCFLKSGDHVVAGAPLYSCMQRVFDCYLPQFSITVDYVPSYGTIDDYRKAIKPNTKIIYGETMCNPMLWVLDVEKFGDLGKELGIMTVVDATFSSPINQNLIACNIDAVVHSSTKYIGGHSDMTSGCCTLRTEHQYLQLREWAVFMGPVVSPIEAAALVRSLRTLELRVERINSNAMKVAEFLEKSPHVKRVLYPGLKSHPQHQVAKQTMKGFGGVMNIELASYEQAITVLESTVVFNAAGSLGAVECLIEHVSTMSHGDFALSAQQREKVGIKDSMLRLSVGIENIEDIIDDIGSALNKAARAHPSPQH